MAAAASCFRLRPQSSTRHISLYINRRSFHLRGDVFTRRSKITPYHHPTRQFSLYSIVTISTTNDKKRYISCSAGGKTVDVKQGEKVREFRKRLRIVDVKGGLDEGLDWLGKKLVVKGWVRTLRVQSSVTFLEVNDGSCLSNMQCVINSDADGYDQVESGFISTGASVWVEGVVVISQGSKQKVELNVGKVITVGRSDSSFPIQKKKVSREFLRTKAHLRPRTNTFGAVARVRNALAYATHKFFQENGFVWVSSPSITASDCEGAEEQFCVTKLILCDL